ncbi:hypothetical protein FA15DRAFT_665824 [Coprinopsis marcescibilis]|uniref:G-patch domain-containing protein n=1 Tax=Coprinopsis marcescibilis TaxID=230819 RepID=A0A5C3L5Q8_COPMA|nr:hypothetical protein FA15DRAFT_665824 [Coprinopsis marcescibilis]
MATVTHTLYSHYDPKHRQRLEQETGQLTDDSGLDPSEQLWQKEAVQAHPRQIAPAPRFVPAKAPFDSWDSNSFASSSKVQLDSVSAGDASDSLYKHIHGSNATTPTAPPRPATTIPSSAIPPSIKPIDKANKNNWFIMKAIKSDSAPATPAPTPTLADILTREPPPLPSEKQFKPPIWLALGPSNKGFSLLQRSGWNEGEALGPDVSRRKPMEPESLSKYFGANDTVDTTDSELRKYPHNKDRESRQPRQFPSVQTVEVKVEDFGDEISEVKTVDVVDLTLTSDSESDSDYMDDDTDSPNPASSALTEATSSNPELPLGVSAHGGRALLTPIATVLKADRMGIGLKPKTKPGPAGAYRIPQKRVTHNSSALATHIRAGEELRKQKKDAGRGRRAFERQRRKEASDRKAMLAYLKS